MPAPMKTLNDLQVGDYVALPNRSAVCDRGPRVEYVMYQIFKRSKMRLHVKYVSGKKWYDQMAIDTRNGSIIEYSGYYAKVATPNLMDYHERQLAERAAWQSQYDRLADLWRKGFDRLSAQQLQALANAWEKVKELP